MLAELKKSVNGVISDGRKKRSFAEVHCVFVYVCKCTAVYVHVYVCIYVCTYMCVHMCICVGIDCIFMHAQGTIKIWEALTKRYIIVTRRGKID